MLSKYDPTEMIMLDYRPARFIVPLTQFKMQQPIIANYQFGSNWTHQLNTCQFSMDFLRII